MKSHRFYGGACRTLGELKNVSLQSDWLSRLLAILAMHGRFDTRKSYRHHWQIMSDPALPGEMPFYIIVSGSAELECPNAVPRSLSTGDIVLLPHGTSHLLRNSRRIRDRTSAKQRRQTIPILEGHADEPGHTEVLSGRLIVEHPHGAFIRKYLPESMVVRSSEAKSATPSQLRNFVKIICDGASTNNEGAPFNHDLLAPALFVMSFRTLSEADEPPTGLIAVAGCKKLAPALEGIFAEPSKSWKLADLAMRCGISRATLLRHFRHELGYSPIELLMDIRMALAANELKKVYGSVGKVAQSIGYVSGAAFRRVFAKHFGLTPTSWRRTLQ